ncbi:MAG: SUMF1/EgtB/PvdO family nonheme iron enzyme [Nitrosomonadaceae bacterium]
MKSLHELAREFAENVIDRDNYRKSRSELIQGICAGKIEVKAGEYLAPFESSPDDTESTRENIITQISREEKDTATVPGYQSTQKSAQKPEPVQRQNTVKSYPPSGNNKQKKFFIATAIIVLLCGITLLILLLPDSIDVPPSDINNQVAQHSTGQILIIDFIQKKNWTEDNLDLFVTSWQQLSDEERTGVQASPEMKRLVNTIYQQLLDERALLSLGDIENAVANQQLLVNFADQLGIDDARLTVLEPELQVDTEIVEIETETIIEATVDPEVEIVAEEITDETEEELMVEEIDAMAAVTDEPLDTYSSTTITESPDTLEETPQQEIPVQKVNTEPEEINKPVQKSANKASCKTSLVKSRKPFCRDKIEGVGNGPTMVVIRSGKFTMGGKNNNEQPVHSVTISSPFAMSVHEISFGDYDSFCQSTKSTCPKQPWSGKDYPVVSITHSEATAYADWLSEKTGQTYRLPSEAEWEYAARAGTKTEYPFGDEILITNAVFSDRKKLSAPLPKSDRSINRNKFRLYHMVGNVREWVADTWRDSYSGAPDDGSARIDSGINEYVIRGGSYTDSANALRSAARDKSSSADNYTGFRVMQELSE